MQYSEIKIELLTITNEANSIVSTKDNDYTHRPSEDTICESIEKCIEELTILRHKIINDSF